MAMLKLKNISDTRRLGACLAENAAPLSNIFLNGSLGSGKTTLARFIVENLPGAAQAEVSSPSFTLCNWYPTSPPVCHCDLYRCQNSIPEEALDAMEDANILVLLEWAEFLPQAMRPDKYLELSFSTIAAEPDFRVVEIRPHGLEPPFAIYS